MKRIYHSYEKWEDYKHGFYNSVSISERDVKIDKVLDLFNSASKTKKYMERVVKEWIYSCEHNLSNESMNRVAYLGQAACCLYAGVPNTVTMYAWKQLKQSVRERSDKIAQKQILLWEQKQRLKDILESGKNETTQTESQTKLPLF